MIHVFSSRRVRHGRAVQVFYSDDQTQQIVLLEADDTGRPVVVSRGTPQPLSELSAAQNDTLLGPDDPWFMATQTVLHPHTVSCMRHMHAHPHTCVSI